MRGKGNGFQTDINLGDDHEGDPHVLRVIHFLATMLMINDQKDICALSTPDMHLVLHPNGQCQ